MEELQLFANQLEPAMVVGPAGLRGLIAQVLHLHLHLHLHPHLHPHLHVLLSIPAMFTTVLTLTMTMTGALDVAKPTGSKRKKATQQSNDIDFTGIDILQVALPASL